MADQITAIARALLDQDRARYGTSEWDRLWDRPDYAAMARVALAALEATEESVRADERAKVAEEIAKEIERFAGTVANPETCASIARTVGSHRPAAVSS